MAQIMDMIASLQASIHSRFDALDGHFEALDGKVSNIQGMLSRTVNRAGLTRTRTGLYPSLAGYGDAQTCRPVRVYPYPTLDPGGSSLGPKFYTLESMSPGLGPSLTIRNRSLKGNLQRNKRSLKTTRDYEDEVIKLNTLKTRIIVRDIL
ncbi:hypothetical protein M9H77_29572 [Catharanthus roseus]|uniref:Uncharacterized protein n=1 Tax=Catharanthus roseus TaxID=4058 RepID=A0ACB9ZWN5_CATRO|nr:hypothetical protein M9H77_29572 [Catharanthus roseus]